ncbi:MAG: A/G-specific adenine glycosylase [Paracoccaceae bacterium]|nr:A/G-specific adenine glycosylase [Paracoccaceae bacterium]
MNKEVNFSENLLKWYDRNARVLPWRVPPNSNKVSNPYFIWLSEIMLQQTTVVTVQPYFDKFLSKWPTIFELALANDQDVMASWAGLGYYARARNLLKCARTVVREYDGKFPPCYNQLIKLPGIGPYTASAILSIAFSKSYAVLDGNVERVISRYYNILDPLPSSKELLQSLAQSNLSSLRPGDYNQAVMDLGATICTPRKPQCINCPVNLSCKAKELGDPAGLPKKLQKKAKPLKFGSVFIGFNEKSGYLLERRKGKGLLGGMLSWPSTDWSECSDINPPILADWIPVSGNVKHTFTHFKLELSVFKATIKKPQKPYFFVSSESFNVNDLPTVMRKAYALYLKSIK